MELGREDSSKIYNPIVADEKEKVKGVDDKENRINEWSGLKMELDTSEEMNRNFRVGEVWWCACGENIGVEINGKNAPFSRPVVVMKKLNKDSFIGIPMTTKVKSGSWYMGFGFQRRNVGAVLAQVRMFSTKRMYGRLGRLDEEDLATVKDGLIKLLSE